MLPGTYSSIIFLHWIPPTYVARGGKAI